MLHNREKFWLILAGFVLLLIITGGTIRAITLGGGGASEIIVTQRVDEAYDYEVFIDGAVARPGNYAVKNGNSLMDVVYLAGPRQESNLNHLKIFVPFSAAQRLPQKVDINRAALWLLQAVPGVGISKAQAIIEYRNQSGFFRNIDDLLKIKGFSRNTLEGIRNYITVEE